MWYLLEEKVPQNDSAATPVPQSNVPNPRHWLGGIQGGGRTIGRKNVDIRLKAFSVSRTHARISTLKASFYSPSSYSSRRIRHSTNVSVQDTSAYGTFLKYPPGHDSNRSQQAVGHHRRLDKDTPTEVFEGALLAFGAPSAWWQLRWEHILLVPSHLSDTERDRISQISALTSVEVADTWNDECTHLVTDHCSSSSIKFLTVLAQGKHVVTTAWVEALRHTVVECCRLITDAPNAEAALAASTIADERRFVPPFSGADQEIFSAEELSAVFEPFVKEQRKGLLKGILLAFTREERRARWVTIIEALGGSTALAKSVDTATKADRIIFVQGELGASRKGQEALDTSDRPYVQESTLSAAIIRADLSTLDVSANNMGDTAPDLAKPTAAEVTDVATPGPLDSDSDVDSDDSEPPAEMKDQATGQPAPIDINGDSSDGDENEVISKPVPRAMNRPAAGRKLRNSSEEKDKIVKDPLPTAAFPATTRKRARAASSISPQESPIRKRQAINSPQAQEVGGKVQVARVSCTEIADNGDVNEREFFQVDKKPSSEIAPVIKGGSKENIVSGRDVRLFRKRKLPQVDVIPVKRVRCFENVEGGFERARPHAESRGRASNSGAQIIDSEEE